jgi:uncharacterized protein (TIGR00290 family)
VGRDSDVPVGERGKATVSYVASWSGGKESCFACYEAIRQGYAVSHLVNFISQEHRRVRFHGTEARLIQLQAEAAGLELVQNETAAGDYEQKFKDTVRRLVSGGVEGMVFGDLYLQEHRDWVEGVCGELDIEAVEPLWGRNLEKYLLEFVDAGFEAVVIAAKAKLIGREWIGRRLDRAFLDFLKGRGIDLCGENGEYHTLVVAGPLFKRSIAVTKSEVIERDGYWFLDTVEYELRDVPSWTPAGEAGKAGD